MTEFEEIAKNVKELNLVETFQFIERLESQNNFISESKHAPINKLNFSIKKGNRCFEFTSEGITTVKDMLKLQSKGYGFHEPFELKGDFGNIVADAAEEATISFGAEAECSGEIWKLESTSFQNSKTFHRAVIPNEYNPTYTHYTVLQSTRFKVGNSVRMAGLCEVKVDGTPFQLYDYKKDNQDHYLMVESLVPIKPDEFERKMACIIYPLGFLTGTLERNEIYIIQSNNIDFKKITGFQYRRIEESVLTSMKVIDPDLFYQLTKKTNVECWISLNIFSNLCSKVFKDHRLLRAVKIIAESNKYPLEVRASTYSVALETLKNIVLEENEDKISPIKNKPTAKKLRKKLTDVVDSFENAEFNNKKAVLNRIEQINQVTNSDGFELSFSLLGIKLSELDKECIKLRNDFLHGRIPFQDEKTKDPKQLQFFAYKLHFLVSALILKYCGFSGVLKNNAKVYDLFHGKKDVQETVFRTI
ncbi:MAG TPA: hypothetical protein DIS94_08730 [Bacteroidetes bacterium]|nr:hypothetical protein [Bacteroidota bacterium]HRE73672.1 hypothetical protein [Flavobacteriales bacterium]HRE95263.1 hypothetical protein [Flavobacteriales bacterium]HRJ37195.1 hypothetical protein [Flavobacteriales bacterium]